MANGLNNLRDFKRFRLDVGRLILWHKDKPVKLARKEIELLCALTENGCEVLTKDELLDKVWHNTFVEESNLTRHIYILRKTLAKFGEKNLIETIPGRGYRFTVEVTSVTDARDEASMPEPRITESGQHALVDLSEWHAVVERLEADEAATPTSVGALAETTELTEELPQPDNAAFPSRRLTVIAVVIAVLFLGSGIFLYRTRQATAHLAEIKSIAVLPFKTIDANKENEHHGLGLTDVLITRLSNIKELNVRPTSAIFAFQNEDSISAGQKLKVDAVLEGTIYRTNEKVRVTTRLLKVRDGAPVWAAQFEQPLRDELKLQDEIALRMIDALAMDMSGSEKTALTKRFTESAEAYQLYLRGRYEWNKRSTPAMREAERLFRNAIDKDPNFALAYVGLADTLATNQGNVEAGWLVEKALELDPNLAEAYATRGFLWMFHSWNWKEAEISFKRSIELNHNYATAHHWYATVLTILGRHEEAKAEMRRSLEINPLSHNFLVDSGQIYYHNREYERAKEYCFKALEIYPDFVNAHMYLHYIYLQTGEYEKAVESQIKVMEINSKFDDAPAVVKESLAGTGEQWRQDFREGGVEGFLLNPLPEQRDLDGGFNYLRAMRNAFLGNKQIALDHLEKAVEQRFFLCPFAKADPVFDKLRDEPRFSQILARMNLDDTASH